MPQLTRHAYWFQEYMSADFNIENGCSAHKHWEMGPDDRFVVGAIQGCPTGEYTARDLQGTELEIAIDQRPVWRVTADLVTVLDAGAQAQIDELRSMMLHLLNLAPPPTTEPSDELKQAMRLADAMRRLGWSPTTQDHRVPSQALVVPPRGELDLYVKADTSVRSAFLLRIAIQGIRQHTVVL